MNPKWRCVWRKMKYKFWERNFFSFSFLFFSTPRSVGVCELFSQPMIFFFCCDIYRCLLSWIWCSFIVNINRHYQINRFKKCNYDKSFQKIREEEQKKSSHTEPMFRLWDVFAFLYGTSFTQNFRMEEEEEEEIIFLLRTDTTHTHILICDIPPFQQRLIINFDIFVGSFVLMNQLCSK